MWSFCKLTFYFWKRKLSTSTYAPVTQWAHDADKENILWRDRQQLPHLIWKCSLTFRGNKTPIIRIAILITSFSFLTVLKIYVHKKKGHNVINVVLTVMLCVLQDKIYLQKVGRGASVKKLWKKGGVWSLSGKLSKLNSYYFIQNNNKGVNS